MGEWFPGQDVPIVKSDARDRMALALANVLTTKSYSDVTVVDLVHASGVSRSTFYRCFQSIDDVVVYTYCRCIEDILNKGLPKGKTREERSADFAKAVSAVVWKNRSVLCIYNRRGLTPFIIDAAWKMTEIGEMDRQRRFGAMYQAAGMAGWLTVLFENGIQDTEEQLRDQLAILLLHGHTSPKLFDIA